MLDHVALILSLVISMILTYSLFVSADQHQIIIETTMFFLLSLLLSHASALSTISYSFSSQATSPYQQPSYLLGSLPQASTLTLTIQLPNPSPLTLSSFIVTIKDANNALSLAFLSFNGTTGSANWTVPNTANYYLQVTTSDTSINALTMYYLAASLNNSPPFFKVSDVLRQRVFRYFYLAANDPSSALITVSPNFNTALVLYTMNPANQLLVLNTQNLSPSLSSDGTSNEYSATNLSPGYYGLYFTVPSVISVTISFQTSPFPCPYSPLYPDYYGTFSGCLSATPSTPGLPCTTYDYTALLCTQCLTGYTITNGKCTLPTICPPRQYYQFGSCYLVNSLCDLYNPYTGDCYSCLNPTQYTLVNSQCISAGVSFCPTGTYLAGSYCVSVYCSKVATNGTCTACVSTAYYLSTGTCLPIDCGSNSYFSVKLNNCTLTPPSCLNFSLLNQLCTNCSSGYLLQNGVCVQPSNSLNCQLLDVTTSQCYQCQSGYSLSQGACQVSNITLPIYCPLGQYLVNKVCVGLPANCLALDSYYACSACAANYQLSGGQCVACSGPSSAFPCLTCPSNYYVSPTGNCLPASPFCLTSSPSNGVCLTCTSGDSPVSGLCCPSDLVVQNGACVTPGSTPSTDNGSNTGSSNGTDNSGSSSGSNSGSSNGSNSGSSNGSNSGSSGGFGSGQKDASYFFNCELYSSDCNCCTECRNGYQFDYEDHCG